MRRALAHYFVPAPPASPGPGPLLRMTEGGREFRFRTAPGVFSRGRVDRGSRLLLQAARLDGARRILDLGCGYGVLGIVAAARAPQATVVLVDINPRAAALAEENVRLNGIPNAEVRCGDGCAPVAGLAFDVILCNPPIRAGRAVVLRLFREARECLAPGGRLYVVARTNQGARTLARALGEVYARVAEVERGGGYRVYEASGV